MIYVYSEVEKQYPLKIILVHEEIALLKTTSQICLTCIKQHYVRKEHSLS